MKSSSDLPMRSRRRRGGLPGIPDGSPEPPQEPVSATAAGDAPAPQVAPPGFEPPDRSSAPSPPQPDAAPAARSDADASAVNDGQDGNRDEQARRPAASRNGRVRTRGAPPPSVPPAFVNPYAQARARQFNFRLLDPVKDRYELLVRELGDEGVRSDLTELMHAVLHEGPQSREEAREVLQRWRLLNAGL